MQPGPRAYLQALLGWLHDEVCFRFILVIAGGSEPAIQLKTSSNTNLCLKSLHIFAILLAYW